mmetsp:Transcript_23747/g.42784  ORF Transcript_23747/g.42784 Transcript_23747/m.42784 type:complete len:607 (-) Transcript_23747:745-2565(-)
MAPPLVELLRGLFVFVLGFSFCYLSFFVYTGSSAGSPPATVPSDPAPLPPPCPAARPSPAKQQAVCPCNRTLPGLQDLSQHAQYLIRLEYLKMLRVKGQPCVDPYAHQRRVNSTLSASAILARCALDWLQAHLHRHTNISRPHSMFDFGYDGLPHPLVNNTGPKWVHFTPLLQQKDLPLPDRIPLPRNQILMAPPTRLRLASLLVTNSLFDLGLILRLDALAGAAGTAGLHVLLGSMLAMARMTFVMLPCGTEGAFQAEGFIQRAVRRALAETKDLGIHILDVDIEQVAVFKHPKCARALMKVTAHKIHRGVRLKWCFYPLGTKYDLVYRENDWVQLVHRYLLQFTRAGGDKVKTIRKWAPSMNMADVVGWGVTQAQRETMFWDMLRSPACPDPAVQNWLMAGGGYVERIDPNQQAIKGKHPEGAAYVEFLRLQMCLSRLGIWKQVETAEALMHQTVDGEYRFATSKFFRKNHAKSNRWDDITVYDMGEYSTCPMCRVCVNHTWPVAKMVWHKGGLSDPTPTECEHCYECQYQHLLGTGIPTSGFTGCTDVEGVGNDTADRNEYCDQSQVGRMLTPSAARLCQEPRGSKGPKDAESTKRCRVLLDN